MKTLWQQLSNQGQYRAEDIDGRAHSIRSCGRPVIQQATGALLKVLKLSRVLMLYGITEAPQAVVTMTYWNPVLYGVDATPRDRSLSSRN